MLNIINKYRVLIVEEEDVTTVLEIVNRHATNYVNHAGNCGWADNPTKWFVDFKAADKKYGKIMKDLLEIGTFEVSVRPGGQVDLCFKKEL